MRKLLPLLLLAGALLLGRQAPAQRSLGRSEAFKNCNAISIETTDDPAQATARLVQLLEANKYQVDTRGAGSMITRLVARGTQAGPAGTQLLFLFYITNNAEILRDAPRNGNTTLISFTGYYGKAGEKVINRISNKNSDVVADAWATEQQLATAYLTPAATVRYNEDDLLSPTEVQLRKELYKGKL